MAQACWDIRHEMIGRFLDAEASVAAACAADGTPIVIADGADATNSGAPGDSVHLLRELLRQHIPDGALTMMVEPHAVAHAATVGVGGRFEFAVGGKRDTRFSQPLPVSATVVSLGPARFRLTGHLGEDMPIDMGQSAVVRIGDVTLLLVERTGPGSTPRTYRCVGLEPQDYKIVIVKSPAGFRAEYEPFAAGIILSACPGCASPRLEQMPYTQLSRPVWPLDRLGEWRDVQWVQRANARFRE